MTRLVGRVLPGSPDWWSLVARISERPGAVALWSAGLAGASRAHAGPSYLACDPTATSSELDPEPELPLAGQRTASMRFASLPRWIGLLPYEARRRLERPAWITSPDPRLAPHISSPLWHRYRAVAVHEPGRTIVVGDDARAVERLWQRLQQPAPRLEAPRVSALPTEPLARHGERIAAALELIRAGDLYQVNLARRVDFAISGSVFGLLRALGSRAPAPYGFAWQGEQGEQGQPSAGGEQGEISVAGTSPELFLRLEPDGRLLTVPIKGTTRRGEDAPSDQRQRHQLETDPKERAELAMIIDVERNDLGRVAEVGSIRLLGRPYTIRNQSLFHRQAELAAQLRPGVSRGEMLEAMLPSGSVTGAPKVRAMEVIAELEPVRRGLYTGAFGLLRHSGGLELAMAIRSATIRGGVGHFHVGGGIVAHSDIEREVRETGLKAAQLLELLEGSAGSPSRLRKRDEFGLSAGAAVADEVQR